ncbi:DUF2306 domain-containing protein [Alkalicaulis satelles]|uniref:DUF2306 domain-containing protein n=1 Tax=Alkalicaulis satelles TaxID=2609175 RepID=A0A5M6ZEK2_9PROT|nr:DUF2306 domain-containing protein [Alkalicaulis satelles]KAA5802304.1 DUF2306 domain-containing protein [Alkalicaulis satelles]
MVKTPVFELKNAGFLVLAALSVSVAAASLRYALPEPPGAPVDVLANAHAIPFLAVHALFGAAALGIGPFQFWTRLRQIRRRLHMGLGVVYAACCVIAGTAGVILAFGNTHGPIAAAGFGLLGAAWLVTTAMAVQAVARGRYHVHRRWMIRSFALTFSAVTLRLQLAVVGLADLPFSSSYIAISFACWVPNLMAAELWIALTARQNQPASRKGA